MDSAHLGLPPPMTCFVWNCYALFTYILWGITTSSNKSSSSSRRHFYWACVLICSRGTYLEVRPCLVFTEHLVWFACWAGGSKTMGIHPGFTLICLFSGYTYLESQNLRSAEFEGTTMGYLVQPVFCSLWDPVPQPWDYEFHAVPTELCSPHAS